MKDVSFEVRRGEVLGVIGRNGAGKSTLLKILSQVTKPTTGRAEIRGHVCSLLEVGTGFHPELTGRENVYLNGAILGMTKREIDRKFDEIVDFAGVEKFIDTPVKRYSSGMSVRLGFAVAAHLDVEIMLVDEVLAVGDIAFQRKCFGKIGSVARQGNTILVVSHNLRVVETLSESCLYLHKGIAAAHGPTLPVLRQYQRDAQNIADKADLPSEFDVDIKTPPVKLTDVVLGNGAGPGCVAVLEPGEPTTLRFTLEAIENILPTAISVTVPLPTPTRARPTRIVSRRLRPTGNRSTKQK